MYDHFKRLIKQVLVYGLGDTINKVLSILTLPIFTRFLSPVDYGVAGVLTVTTALIAGLADLGLSAGIARFFIEEKEPKKSHLIFTAQIASVSLTLLLALLALPFADFLSNVLLKNPGYGYIVKLNFFTIPLLMLIQPLMMRFRLEEKSKLYAGINLARVITGIILSLVLIVGLKRGINGLFEGPFINAAIYALILGFYSLKNTKLHFSRESFQKMFFFGYPFIFSSVSFWILNWADRFVLARLSNLSEVGLYSLGYTLGMAIMLPIGAFSTAWTSFYMSVAKNHNAKEIYSLIFTYFALVIGFFVLLISVFGRDYFEFFTTANFHGAYTVIPVITLAYALNGCFSIVAIGSFLAKRTILDMITELTAMIVNIAMMFVLIPYLGRMGAAWATFGAYLVLPIMMFFLLRKIYHIKYEYLRIFKILVIGFGLYFLCRTIYQPILFNLIIRVLVVLTYPVILYFLNFFKADELKRIDQIFKKIKKFKLPFFKQPSES